MPRYVFFSFSEGASERASASERALQGGLGGGVPLDHRIRPGGRSPKVAPQGPTRSKKAHPNAGLRLLSFGPGWKAGGPILHTGTDLAAIQVGFEGG